VDVGEEEAGIEWEGVEVICRCHHFLGNKAMGYVV